MASSSDDSDCQSSIQVRCGNETTITAERLHSIVLANLDKPSRTSTVLLSRPAKRPLTIRTNFGRSKAGHESEGPEINFRRVVNCEAALIQTRGNVAKTPCLHCSRGLSPFTDCVKIEGIARDSCAGCHFNASGTRCTLRPKVREGSRDTATRSPSPSISRGKYPGTFVQSVPPRNAYRH
ncbi:hypothetical protein QBC40DRAFT_222739 [Triangularia verruculosa]|uniref:Uncharacterized protein n=1 Tax=Triangularia verruculosa TaxID=2587418 RepID=A0AAN6XNR6_9PEZI|nr:hypothetical protein QBC40DRAFT_222739 [Triangularia verruculosa]